VSISAPGGPSRVWYWVGGAVGLIGVIATVAWIAGGVRGIDRQVDRFQRVDVGDEGPITIDDPGGYTIYYEGPYADVEAPDVRVTIEGPGVGRGALGDYDSELTYSFGGREGRAILTMRFDEPGTFLLASTSEGGGRGQIAVGRSIGPRLVRTVLGGVFLGVYTLGGTTGVILLTALRRRDARRRSAEPPPMIRT
jgi:hypothetical protein